MIKPLSDKAAATKAVRLRPRYLIVVGGERICTFAVALINSKTLDWITDKIAIGNYFDGTDAALIEAKGIRSILCLDCNIRAPQSLKTPRFVVHLQDEPVQQLDNFLAAIETLERLVLEAGPVLVHCHAGRSRSVVVVAGYLMKARGLSPEEALGFVRERREISITPGVEQLLYFI